jgi:hypothetical protein
MSRNTFNGFCLFVAVILFMLLTVQPTAAQEIPQLHDVFPQRGGLDQVVNFLLRGDGFERIKSLDGVFASGSQLEVFEFEVLSNELIEIQARIPKETPVGETEIRFVFDDNAYDAYFVVTEGGEEDISPMITQVLPKEGEVDSEMSLLLELRYQYATGVTLIPRYEWGEFVNLIIGGVEITVITIEASDSGDAFKYQIYLPPETPIGATQIHLYYENFSYRDDFVVTRSGRMGIYEYSPNEGQIDQEIEFLLEGENLSDMGDLNGVMIADRDVEVLYDSIESDQLAAVGVYLPPEIPAGEAGIIFFYDNYVYENVFFVVGTVGDANIQSVTPQQGELDREVEFVLEGENLFGLGELVGVEIAGADVPVYYDSIDSGQLAAVGVYLPPELPTGETWMVFHYENYAYESAFLVIGEGEPIQDPVLLELWPQEGEAGTDIELYLEGENLFSLGELEGVDIAGVGLPVWGYEIESNDTSLINVYLPEETPLGEHRITVTFQNADIREVFVVQEASIIPDPWVLILIGGVVGGGVLVGGGILIYRAINKNKISKDKVEERPKEEFPDVELRVTRDDGIQTVGPERSSLTWDLDLRLEVNVDPGEQSIDTGGKDLVDDE